jgi:hypothetical protein
LLVLLVLFCAPLPRTFHSSRHPSVSSIEMDASLVTNLQANQGVLAPFVSSANATRNGKRRPSSRKARGRLLAQQPAPSRGHAQHAAQHAHHTQLVQSSEPIADLNGSALEAGDAAVRAYYESDRAHFNSPLPIPLTQADASPAVETDATQLLAHEATALAASAVDAATSTATGSGSDPLFGASYVHRRGSLGRYWTAGAHDGAAPLDHSVEHDDGSGLFAPRIAPRCNTNDTPRGVLGSLARVSPFANVRSASGIGRCLKVLFACLVACAALFSVASEVFGRSGVTSYGNSNSALASFTEVPSIPGFVVTPAMLLPPAVLLPSPSSSVSFASGSTATAPAPAPAVSTPVASSDDWHAAPCNVSDLGGFRASDVVFPGPNGTLRFADGADGADKADGADGAMAASIPPLKDMVEALHNDSSVAATETMTMHDRAAATTRLLHEWTKLRRDISKLRSTLVQATLLLQTRPDAPETPEALNAYTRKDAAQDVRTIMAQVYWVGFLVVIFVVGAIKSHEFDCVYGDDLSENANRNVNDGNDSDVDTEGTDPLATASEVLQVRDSLSNSIEMLDGGVERVHGVLDTLSGQFNALIAALAHVTDDQAVQRTETLRTLTHCDTNIAAVGTVLESLVKAHAETRDVPATLERKLDDVLATLAVLGAKTAEFSAAPSPTPTATPSQTPTATSNESPSAAHGSVVAHQTAMQTNAILGVVVKSHCVLEELATAMTDIKDLLHDVLIEASSTESSGDDEDEDEKTETEGSDDAGDQAGEGIEMEASEGDDTEDAEASEDDESSESDSAEANGSQDETSESSHEALVAATPQRSEGIAVALRTRGRTLVREH